MQRDIVAEIKKAQIGGRVLRSLRRTTCKTGRIPWNLVNWNELESRSVPSEKKSAHALERGENTPTPKSKVEPGRQCNSG